MHMRQKYVLAERGPAGELMCSLDPIYSRNGSLLRRGWNGRGGGLLLRGTEGSEGKREWDGKRREGNPPSQGE